MVRYENHPYFSMKMSNNIQYISSAYDTSVKSIFKCSFEAVDDDACINVYLENSKPPYVEICDCGGGATSASIENILAAVAQAKEMKQNFGDTA